MERLCVTLDLKRAVAPGRGYVDLVKEVAGQDWFELSSEQRLATRQGTRSRDCATKTGPTSK